MPNVRPTRPTLARAAATALACLAVAVAPARARAQTTPSAVPAVPAVPRDTVPRDTARRAVPDTTGRAARGPRRRPVAAQRPGLLPPIKPGKAFLSSLLLPGLGQSRLGRPTAGAVFVGIEVAALTMLIKSNNDLHSARLFGNDTVATSYPLDSLGAPAAKPPTRGLDPSLVSSRRLHREDWIAALVFNHLISGAEAFVSANLYDLPAQITARPSSQGTLVALSIQW